MAPLAFPSHVTPHLAFTGSQWAVILVALAIGLAIQVALVLWLYRDVQATTGRDPRPWAAFGAVAIIPTLIVWTFVRPRPQPPAGRMRTDPMRPDPMRSGPPPRHQPGPDPADDADPFGLGLRSGTDEERPTEQQVRAETRRPSAQGPGSAAAQEVSCPRCATRFEAPPATGHPTRVTCPGCGATGHV